MSSILDTISGAETDYCLITLWVYILYKYSSIFSVNFSFFIFIIKTSFFGLLLIPLYSKGPILIEKGEIVFSLKFYFGFANSLNVHVSLLKMCTLFHIGLRGSLISMKSHSRGFPRFIMIFIQQYVYLSSYLYFL